MKKVIALAALIGLVGLQAKGREFVTINVSRLLAESEQGKALRGKIDAQVDQLQAYQNTEVAQLQEKNNDLLKQSKAMDAEALQGRVMALQMEERRLKRELQARQEDLQSMADADQQTLRRQLTSVASEMLNEKGWGTLVDRSMPGVIASADDIDVTDQVLNRVNEQFEKDSAQPRDTTHVA